MELSIVTSMYRSSAYIEEFYKRISASAKKITDSYEIIFVNDGSPDNSLELAVELHKKDKHVKVLNLSRNFGHHKAIMSGLSYAKGQKVLLIDIDLEEDPELLNTFNDELEANKELDVVYGVLKQRKGGWFEKFSGSIFFKVFNFFSDQKVPENFAFCRLLKRDYVNALLEYKEHEVFLGGIWYAAGFNQKAVEIIKKSKGTSTYTLRKRVSLAINAITSFSNKPLIYIFTLGVLISFFSILYVLYLIIGRVFFDMGFTGYTTIVASIWIIGGIIIFCIGIVGIYLSRVFVETKKRPYSIIKKYYE